jgi:hypothetical protein
MHPYVWPNGQNHLQVPQFGMNHPMALEKKEKKKKKTTTTTTTVGLANLRVVWPSLKPKI